MTDPDKTGFPGPGGRPGGLGTFLLGFVMAVAGGYLLLQQVTITGGYWQLWGVNAFGLSLVPLLFGVFLLFFRGDSKPGWLLLIAGAVIILVGILSHMDLYFRPTSLYNTLLMLVLLVGGLGLIARSVKTGNGG
ncbi:MAG: hypothetical protein ABI609_05785 [Acidobacteriota bacterium]